MGPRLVEGMKRALRNLGSLEDLLRLAEPGHCQLGDLPHGTTASDVGVEGVEPVLTVDDELIVEPRIRLEAQTLPKQRTPRRQAFHLLAALVPVDAEELTCPEIAGHPDVLLPASAEVEEHGATGGRLPPACGAVRTQPRFPSRLSFASAICPSRNSRTLVLSAASCCGINERRVIPGSVFVSRNTGPRDETMRSVRV